MAWAKEILPINLWNECNSIPEELWAREAIASDLWDECSSIFEDMWSDCYCKAGYPGSCLPCAISNIAIANCAIANSEICTAGFNNCDTDWDVICG